MGSQSQGRVVVEELDLTVRALNALRATDVRYVDQVVISALRGVDEAAVVDEIRTALIKFHGIDYEGPDPAGSLGPAR